MSLQLAVEQGFGGADSREKANWLVGAINTWFKENGMILILFINYRLIHFCPQ